MASYLSDAPDPVAKFKQQSGYSGIPRSHSVMSHSAMTNKSGSWTVASQEIKTGEVAAMDAQRFGSVYGGRTLPGMSNA